MIETVDYHSAGEPFRIVLSGVPELPGATVRARRAAVSEEADAVRRLVCHEPRGHADMYGCFLVPPDDDGAHFGVLFWHKDGYSTACGHGTIALGAWAVEYGRVTAAPDGETEVVIDVPSGRVTARVRRAAGRLVSVSFRNVPSYVLARDVPYGSARVDVSYGGAVYVSVRAGDLGLSVTPDALPELIAAGRAVKAALTPLVDHPDGIYGTILYDELPDTPEGPHQRNVTVFADGQVDRSPCGSGTSARLALLSPDGVLTHDSIVGSRFLGRIGGRTEAGVVTEIEGTAYRTGEHRFTLDPDDTLGTGFVLR
ncbi:proline racemase family protein [Actinoallomurus bryophytorum]|uniref:Trans-L-3-hydroxyproline dehydratase n=1 Tax=Actinoallomurus bryophytorum TaxID=1490222 RepID=A0A543CWS7_9ACTN|nr:proline racemase family protein [Actinoallomurus bryophytorum]TQM01567.1 trans-L-3-hydroxyproline dehydratase [Actinoallomurus bryophytorum]